jgi:hypothetical protein
VTVPVIRRVECDSAGPYSTVGPTSNCALELPDIVPDPTTSDFLLVLPCEPQPVNPRTANATARAPAASLREVDVLCIVFFLSSCYCRVFEQLTALGADNGRLCRLAGIFGGAIN